MYSSYGSWGPTPWLLGAEIFPLRARAKGMALSTISNWIFNFIIAFITPPLFSAIHGGYYFLLLGFCAISGVFVYFVYPETAHLTLEELGEAFGDKVMDDAKLLSPAMPPNALGHPEGPQDVKAVIEQVEKAQVEDIHTVGGSTANINN